MRTLVYILLITAWADVPFCSKVGRFRATQISLRVILNKNLEIKFALEDWSSWGRPCPKKTRVGVRVKALE